MLIHRGGPAAHSAPKVRAGKLPLAVGPAQAMAARSSAPSTMRVGLFKRL